jgi:hypothetical protein
MLYIIIGTDTPSSLEKRKSARPDHLARLQALRDAGRLIVAGPFPAVDNDDPGAAGFTGSVIIAEFASLEDAKLWANTDPYIVAGVYEQITIKPFKQVF